MLNTKQLQTLRDLVSINPDNGDAGALCGKGYREIAEKLGESLGVPVTADSVRHYIRAWRREAALHLVPPQHGWPKGKKRNQARGRKPLPWAFMYRELLALTGWSVSQLHAELKSAGFDALPARRTLQEQIERSGTLEALPSVRRHGRVKLTDRYVVRIHQMALTRVPEKSYWVIMAAYEIVTGFLNVAVLDLAVPDDQPRPRGRPKVMDIDEPVGVVEHREGGDFVRLQLDRWRQFCTETTDRLGLPVGRFEYVSNFGLEPMLLKHQEASADLVSACKAGADVPSHPVSESVYKQFSSNLTSVIRRHNQRRQAVIDRLREEAVSRLKEVRDMGEPGIRYHRPLFGEAERYALIDYFRGLDGVKKLQIGRQAYRAEKAWITLHRQGEQVATSDVAPPPVET